MTTRDEKRNTIKQILTDIKHVLGQLGVVPGTRELTTQITKRAVVLTGDSQLVYRHNGKPVDIDHVRSSKSLRGIMAELDERLNSLNQKTVNRQPKSA